MLALTAGAGGKVEGCSSGANSVELVADGKGGSGVNKSALALVLRWSDVA